MSRNAVIEPAVSPEIRIREGLLPPYAVILHNDDVNTMEHVVQSLLRCVPDLGQERAVEIMLEAHNHGRALVVVCVLELAEARRDCLRSQGLTATLEKV